MGSQLLHGVRVIDPATDLDRFADVLVGPEGESDDVVDVVDVEASDALLVPGLIDLHAHVDDIGMEGAVPPDVPGVGSGVTTVVDAGSSGAAHLENFLAALEGVATQVLPFVNIAHGGLEQNPEIRKPDDLDLDALRAALTRHRDAVHGLKVRVVSPAVDLFGIELVRSAKLVAGEFGLPLMVHVGDPNSALVVGLAVGVVDLLEAGDVLTHAMSSQPGALLSSPEAKAAAVDARQRGVLFDVGHGIRNFSFDAAAELVDAGIVPHTISTDIGKRPRGKAAFSLTETMTKFLLLGFGLREVVAMTTVRAADAVSQPQLGRLAAATRPDGTLRVTGDASLLAVRRGPWTLTDSTGTDRTADTGLVPLGCFRDGVFSAPGEAPHPEGWLRPTS